MSKSITYLFVLILMLLPSFSYANSMPGAGDYLAILLFFSFILSFFLGVVTVVLFLVFGKKRRSFGYYLIRFLIVLIGIPLLTSLLFSILLFL